MKWKIFQWMKFLFRHFPNWQENWAGRNFITNSRVYSLLITQAKMQTEINNNLRMAVFWPIGTAQIIRIVSYPIRKKSRFWLFGMWSVKEMYHAFLQKTDYRDKRKGHDRRLIQSGECQITSCYVVFTACSCRLILLHRYYRRKSSKLLDTLKRIIIQISAIPICFRKFSFVEVFQILNLSNFYADYHPLKAAVSWRSKYI